MYQPLEVCICILGATAHLREKVCEHGRRRGGDQCLLTVWQPHRQQPLRRLSAGHRGKQTQLRQQPHQEVNLRRIILDWRVQITPQPRKQAPIQHTMPHKLAPQLHHLTNLQFMRVRQLLHRDALHLLEEIVMHQLFHDIDQSLRLQKHAFTQCGRLLRLVKYHLPCRPQIGHRARQQLWVIPGLDVHAPPPIHHVVVAESHQPTEV